MKLASAEQVVEAMGVVGNSGSWANASRALELSYPIVENVLETTLLPEHRTDYFDATKSERSFRLTNMFVDSGSLVVRRSLNGDQLLNPNDGELLTVADYALSADKGILNFRQDQPTGEYQISVEYDSGLPISDYDEEMLDAPQWLRECGIAMAVYILNTLPSSPANRKEKSVVSVTTELRALASQFINPRMRPRMTVVFPTLSVLDE